MARYLNADSCCVSNARRRTTRSPWGNLADKGKKKKTSLRRRAEINETWPWETKKEVYELSTTTRKERIII